jgi:hypothetical protein
LCRKDLLIPKLLLTFAMTIIQKTDETDDEDTKTEGATNSTLAAQQLYYQRLIWNWGGQVFKFPFQFGQKA